MSGTTTVAMAAAGDSGTGYSYTLTVDGTTVSSGANGTFSWNTMAVADGPQTLTASVKDTTGATGTGSITVTVSNGITPLPRDLRLSFVSAAADATVSGTTTVSLAASPTSTSTTTSAAATTYTYRLTVDGTALAGTGASFFWNTTSATNGEHTLTGTVTDSTGLSATTTPTVTASKTIPPPFTRPTSGATLRGTLWVVLWVSGPTGTSNTYTLSAAGKTVATRTTSSMGPAWIAWNTTKVANGAQTLTATVTDATGNTGSVSIPVIVDNGTVTRTPAPTLTAAFTSPAANATVRGTTTIGISATGSTAATRTFRLSIDGTVVSTQRVTGTTAAYTRSTTAVPDGSHTLRLVVIDGAGRHVNRHQHGDRLQHHHAGADGHRQRSLGHRNTYTMSVNGRVIGTQTVSSTGPVSTPWNTTTAAGGTHVLPVTVTDATGNTGAANVTVTVRNQQWAL